MKTTFYNAKVITPEVIIDGGVVTDNGRIERVFKGKEYEKGGNSIDCKGHYLTPGFVETHIHATVKGQFVTNDPEEMERACMLIADHGTTSVLPTAGSRPIQMVYDMFATVGKIKGKNKGANIVGTHLEGIYLNTKFAGAQMPGAQHNPVEEEYMRLYDTGLLKRVSASPELPGALEMGRVLSSKGVLMSIAHSGATHDDVLAAIDAGYSHVTHIYNALSYLDNCYYFPKIGVCEAALLHDEITIEAICDGCHVPLDLIQLIYKVKGAERFHATSDAVCAGGVEGDDVQDGKAIIRNNVCVLKDKDVFDGSCATSERLIRNLVKANIPLIDAIKMVSLTPAKTIGEKNIGRIAEGYDADINILNENFDVLYTMIKGKEYRKTAF